MELNQVRYFLTLADTLNFTRAAETCNVTQPALTRAIQKLEEEIGGLLFHRERNLTQLTALGRLMKSRLEQASAAAQSAREEALAFKRRENSPLRLGLDHSISASVLTPVLRELALHFKGFELLMSHASSVEICRQLLDDSLDVAMIVELNKLSERLHRWPLYEERLVVLCPTTHRFAEIDEVPLAEVGAERILRREMPNCAIAADLEPHCAAAGINLQFHHSGSQEDLIREMVQAALGIAVAGERQPVPQDVVVRKLAGVPPRTVVLTAVAGRR